MSSALLFTFNDDTISKTAPVSLHDLTFDEILKFINTPKYNKHSFLREECMNNNNNNTEINDNYLTEYGYEFADTKYYKYNDSIHWIILSIICIGLMFIIYPLILFCNSLLLIYRHEYYKYHSTDPLFICKFC
eukprot:241860_1